jgi:GTP pyrophosphokinase
MDVVAESGVAAHWLYKTSEQNSQTADRMGSKWLQSLLDIHDETRDAAEFWDHVKIDLFPDAVYVFTPKHKILSMPRGATMVDFAYAIHSNVGDRTVGAKVNGNQVPLRTELKNGDIIEVTTDSSSNPNPGWLGFVKTGRARSKIRHYLKTMAQSESIELGEKLLLQSSQFGRNYSDLLAIKIMMSSCLILLLERKWQALLQNDWCNCCQTLA